MAPAASEPAVAPQVVAVVLIAAAFAGLVCWGWFGMAAYVPDEPADEGTLLSALYDPPTRGVEVALNARDGQVFATLAVDPTIRQPDLLRGGPEEQAYRHQRPMLGWIGWAASGGHPDAVPWALVVVVAASVVGLVGVTAEAIRRRGGPPAAALILLITPGVMTDLTFIGPEALGTMLVLVGVGAWSRSPRATLIAVAAFAAAGLCRETLLVVPAALALRELYGRRVVAGLALACSAGPYIAWVLVLRGLVGSWPVGSVPGRISPVPLAGMIHAAGGWPPGEVAVIGLTLGLGIAGLVRGREPILRMALVAQVPLIAVLGEPVWIRSADVGRVLLPFAVLGLVALTAARPSPAEGPGLDAATDAEVDGGQPRATDARPVTAPS